MPTTKKTSTFMAPAASIKHDQTKKSRPYNKSFHVHSHLETTKNIYPANLWKGCRRQYKLADNFYPL